MRSAKDEQDMRGKRQMVNLIHSSTHITSYEFFLFRKEVDCVEEKEGGEWDEVSIGLAEASRIFMLKSV